jgi:hypothetical protein
VLYYYYFGGYVMSFGMSGFYSEVLKNNKYFKLEELKVKNYYSPESTLYLITDGIVYKEFSTDLMNEDCHPVDGLAEKLQYAKFLPEGVVKPTALVFKDAEHICGYIMPKVKGRSLDELERDGDPFDCSDIARYRDIYYKLKKIIVDAGDKIVFPNLLDTRNIFIDNEGNVSLVSFDDVQLGPVEGHMDSDIECIYGGPELETEKYQKDGLFTKNLDIRSLVFLYFYLVFTINLNYFSKFSFLERKYEIERALQSFGIEDPVIVNKIDKLFDPDVDNEFIDDFVDEFTEKYSLMYYFDFHKKMLRKKPIKKFD